MFVVEINYTRPIEEIEAATADHRAFVDIHIASGLLLLAGPKVPRTGGFLIARGGQTRDELLAVLADDPFLARNLADYVVTEFNAGKHNPALASLI
jgi:uncharacterized protein YciI